MLQSGFRAKIPNHKYLWNCEILSKEKLGLKNDKNNGYGLFSSTNVEEDFWKNGYYLKLDKKSDKILRISGGAR